MQLRLWTLRTDELSAAALAVRLGAVLSTDERAEARRFQRAANRHEFVLARALARLALSHQFPVAAQDWRFARDRNGRPFIAAPEVSPAVHFSVSHTRGLVACLISSCAEAAVDVEQVEHHPDLALVSEQILTPAERGALSELRGAAWTARFFDYWTLKEAYAKARGLGLCMAFSDIGFDLDAHPSIRVQLAAGADDDASAWVFWQRRLPPQHTICVAAKRSCASIPPHASGEPPYFRTIHLDIVPS